LSRYFRARITENLPLNSNHNIISLANLEDMEEPLPGQFFMVQINQGYDPLLKRPFSIYRKTSEGFELLFRIKGKGTALLKGMKEGAVIDVIGPLGNSYPLPSESQFPVIIAGGIGIASVHPLVERLSGKAYVIYGAKIGDELFMREDLEKIAGNLLLCTDDGSCGQKGTVIDVITGLRSRLREMREVIIYSCGPAAMVREVTMFAAEHAIKAYVSLEEHMACGIGACLGCVVKTRKGYRRVCREGPVFDAADIIWREDPR